MLWFWVVVLVALIGAIAVVAAGRGDTMVDVYDDRPDASLPAGRPLNAEDLRTVRLTTGVRGYRMDEVDALLGRLEAEMIDREDDERVVVVGVDDVAARGDSEERVVVVGVDDVAAREDGDERVVVVGVDDVAAREDGDERVVVVGPDDASGDDPREP